MKHLAVVGAVVLAAVVTAGACGVPLAAIRRGPPAGLDGRIAAPRAKAPMFELAGTGGTFRLTEALAKQHVLIVFYRGHW